MISIIGQNFERVRHILMPDSRNKFLEAGTIQTIREKLKSVELLSSFLK